MTAQTEPVRQLIGRRADLSRGGDEMLLIFVGAALVVTFAVAITAVVERWWVLAPTMLVDFAATFGVTLMITHLLAEEDEAG